MVRFKKFCRKCDKIFTPSGPSAQLCDKCFEKSKVVGTLRSKLSWAIRRNDLPVIKELERKLNKLEKSFKNNG